MPDPPPAPPPVRDDPGEPRALDCDVAVAGAGLGGLVAGAILARRGLRVVVVDRPPRVGGRGGATPYHGFWLDGGQRDGGDVTDIQVGWRYGQLAAQEAGVEVPLRTIAPDVRVHHLRDGAPAAIAHGRWGAAGFAAMARDAFGCPEALLPDFMKAVARLAAATDAERRAAVATPLGDWLAAHVPEPALRRALLTMVTVIYSERPERASAGRLMAFFGRRDDLPAARVAFADHAEVGGMQGLMEPFARAIRARGGELRLGLEPVEVCFDGPRAAGLVAVDESHLVLELRARAVVIAYPLWQALPLLPPERVSPDLAALARALEDEQADAVCWQAGLARLPRLRANGAPEAHAGWNRVVVGEQRRYLGGWHLPSLGSRRSAPPGHHLLHAFIARWQARDERRGWPAARAAIERLRAHLSDFYVDLDACVAWSAYQYIARPACLAWYWAPRERHGVRTPDCEHLYLAGTTIESDAGPVDIAAHAGLLAARAALEDVVGRGAPADVGRGAPADVGRGAPADAGGAAAGPPSGEDSA